MKWLVVTVLIIAQQPSEAPKDKRTAETNRAQSAAHTKNTESRQTPPAQPTPVPAQSSIGTEGQFSSAITTSHTGQSNQQTSGEDLRIQRKLAWFTGALVIVGVLQAVVMYLTWRVYRRQAREMRRQRHEMRQQRHIMWRQWKSMGKQAELMREQMIQMESAGRQTDELIAETRKNADAAIDNAKAAQGNLDLIINKERARLRVEVNDIALRVGLSPLYVSYNIYFHGFTDAFSVDAQAYAVVSESKELPDDALCLASPIWQLPAVVTPSLPLGNPFALKVCNVQGVDQSLFEDINNGKRFLHFAGIIRYQDFMGKPRDTVWQYRWKALDPSAPLSGISVRRWEKAGPPEANRET